MNPLLKILIILISAKILGEAAERLGQPSILGELFAGLLIGPSLLNLLTSDPITRSLSDIGLVFLLFLAGTEVKIEDIRRSGKDISIIATGGVITPFLIGLGIGVLFFDLGQAMVVAVAFVFTSISVTVRTLIRLNKLGTKVGSTILGVAVLDDIAGIILISILLGSHGEVLPLILSIITLPVIIYFVGTRFLPRILRFSMKLIVEEAVFSTILVSVLLYAILSHEMGLSLVIGSFLAGMVFARIPEFSDQERRKFSGLAYGFLIPFFFVNAGLIIDLKVISEVGVFAALAIPLALIGKLLGCGITAWISGFRGADVWRIGIGMMPRLDVTLVVVTTALSIGTIGGKIYSSILLVVISSVLLTPPLLKIAYRDRSKTAIKKYCVFNL